jgi:acyl-homoserine-lactone acylase
MVERRFAVRRPALGCGAAALALVVALAGCAGAPERQGRGAGLRERREAPPPEPPNARAATVTRTANGVAHVHAPDLEALAYGMAYAYAQDNVCLTADHLVTVRGERSRHFGPAARAIFGSGTLPNEQIDLFVAAFMDDQALARSMAAQGEETRALMRGYVAGYNRYLADHAGRLPAACHNAAWVRPMTQAEFLRIGEVSAIQAGLGALAEAVLGAAPPPAGRAGAAQAAPPAVDLADAAAALREWGVSEPRLGSNAWAFGRQSTGTGAGMLLGNPHFPWVGTNRFWQVHLTVPGQLDVMGVSIGTAPVVVIGFNKDVAWSHTVSTGRRFTLHELTLVPGDPTSYLVDGQPEKMTSRTVTVASRDAAGQPVQATRTLWSTRYGPLMVAPRTGLTWTAERAYALQDANRGNQRGAAQWLAYGRAASVADLQRALPMLGMPWVNTIAADRHGNAFYADASVVPDVDAAQLTRCRPSAAAGRLSAAGLVVLDGSKGECNWRRDPASPVPGLVPTSRLPQVVRADWVHNSNDSYLYTHPEQKFSGIAPLVGDDIVRQQRTRAGLIEVPALLAAGPVTLQGMQRQLFGNRNHVAEQVLPELLAACAGAPTPDAREGCAALAGWDRKSDLGSRGAHLFREFWRRAMALPKVWRVPFDKARPVATPTGLNLADAEVAAKVWEALALAVQKVRGAGFALDAPLGDVQRPAITDEPIALHGGQSFEGVLNYLGDNASPGIGPKGLRIDYGTSYVQTVTFDARGPVAEALLTYGQSTDPASPHVADQLRLFSRKAWPRLPFHAEDVARERVGPVLRLVIR